MLQQEDLRRFAEHARCAAHEMSPEDPLNILAVTTGGLFPEELLQLSRSLEIAALLGDVEEGYCEAIRAILGRLKESRCLTFDDASAWQRAIAWAFVQPTPDLPRGPSARSIQVAEACRRLRKKNYKLCVEAYGVVVDDNSQKSIAEYVDCLVSHLGGLEVLHQICQYVKAADLIHDGMWLMGNRVPGIYDVKQPSLPIGWLISLSLRHIGKTKLPRNPPVVWKNIVTAATDLASAMNCQRYSQFEDIDIRPTSVWRVLVESLLWREIFTLPQVPKQVLPRLREALKVHLSSEQIGLPGWSLDNAFDEVAVLQQSLSSEQCIRLRRDAARSRFPTLWCMGVGEPGAVNPSYCMPTRDQTNHNRFLFYGEDTEHVIALPLPFFREAFCQILFTEIWTKLKNHEASKLVGSIYERVIAEACRQNTSLVLSDCEYLVGKQRLQIDVATDEPDQIVLFETKSKALTAAARSGDMSRFFEDYADSFLAMAHQLVRHDSYLRLGQTPLPSPSTGVRPPAKVAVSPLSFGPISDKWLANGILRGFIGAQLVSQTEDKDQKRALDKFNKAMKQVHSFVIDLAPKSREGEPNVFGYLIDMFWLDVGELLYILDRGNSVAGALKPLHHMTFTSRDFWTEIALADRQGLTQKYWKPIS